MYLIDFHFGLDLVCAFVSYLSSIYRSHTHKCTRHLITSYNQHLFVQDVYFGSWLYCDHTPPANTRAHKHAHMADMGKMVISRSSATENGYTQTFADGVKPLTSV